MYPKIALRKDFELVELIGHGVSSEVYKGLRADSNREFTQVVAIKIFKSSKFRKKYQNELKNLSKLNHPNIISVKDWGEFEDKFYLITEYIHGLDLATFIKLKNNDLKLKKFILNQIFEGLKELKNKGVAHADLKPSNIMLSISGEVKLVDISFDDVGQIFATPEYSSPEVLSGTRPSFQSDLYSLGVITQKLELNQKKLTSLEPGDREFEEYKNLNNLDEKLKLSEVIRKNMSLDPEIKSKNSGTEFMSQQIFTQELLSPSSSYGLKPANHLKQKVLKVVALNFLLFLLFGIGTLPSLPSVQKLKLRSLKAYEFWNEKEWVSLPTDQDFYFESQNDSKKLKFRTPEGEVYVKLSPSMDFSKNIIIDAL